MTGRDNEFIINAGIFSFAIGDFFGYHKDRKDAADMHHSHYIEHQYNITRHKDWERFAVEEDGTFSLGITVREILVEIDRFFQSVKNEDAFLEHLLENGCGLGSLFPDKVVKYTLLTQRWEYAEELIKREEERRQEWTYSPLLVEKYKELCYDDSGYRAYHARPGMVAAVSGKVRKFLEDQTVSKDEYTLKPVRILGLTNYYLF